MSDDWTAAGVVVAGERRVRGQRAVGLLGWRKTSWTEIVVVRYFEKVVGRVVA